MSTNSSTATVESLFYDFRPGYMSINDDEIKVTIDHEFWVFQDGLWRWKRANELEVGNLLYTFIGGVKPIEDITFVSGEVEVIQFDVEPLDVNTLSESVIDVASSNPNSPQKSLAPNRPQRWCQSMD